MAPPVRTQSRQPARPRIVQRAPSSQTVALARPDLAGRAMQMAEDPMQMLQQDGLSPIQRQQMALYLGQGVGNRQLRQLLSPHTAPGAVQLQTAPAPAITGAPQAAQAEPKAAAEPERELSWGERAAKWAFEKALAVAGVEAGQVKGLVNRAGGAVMAIVREPGHFLGVLIRAIGQGFTQFKDNIGKHLQSGLMSWLFGTMARAGIEAPKDFSPRSILALVLQILGITAERLKQKAARFVGEKNVRRIEKAWDILSTFLREGLGGLWEMLKEYLGDLQQTVVEEVKGWVITQVIQAAVVKVLSLFNPVSGLISIVKAIYNVIKFLVDRAGQIAALFQAIAGSVAELALGNVKGAADRVEQALARVIPVAIGFLANLLGIGGIADKVKDIVQKVQQRVDQAIDKMIGGVVRGLKKVGGFAATTAKVGSAWVKSKPGGSKGRGTEEISRSTEVKQKARTEITAQSGRLFTDRNAAQSFVAEILSKLRPEGLVGLTLKPKQDKHGQYNVVAVASPAETVGDIQVAESGDLEAETKQLFDEVQGLTAFEAQTLALSTQQEPMTRLSPSSASLSQKQLEHHIERSNASEQDKAQAKAIARQKIATALLATKGDRIFDLLRTAQGAVNGLIKAGQVTIDWKKQLQTHHAQEVHEHPRTFPREFRARVGIPERWQAAIQQWAKQLVDMPEKQRHRRRRELVNLVRDSLTEEKMERPTSEGKIRGKAVLEEVDMIVTTALRHSEHHRRERETVSTRGD